MKRLKQSTIRGVIRTEDNLVTTGRGSIGRFGQRDTAAHESPAAEDGVDRRQQVGPGRYLVNVAVGAQTERLSDDIRRGLLAHEEQSRAGGEPADLFRDLESIQLRQIDVEQNQIRLQFFGLPHGLQPIRRLDDLELRPSLKRRTNETAERRMVFHYENRQRHKGPLFLAPSSQRASST